MSRSSLPAARLNPPRHQSWFAYFPQDYRWSAAVAGMLGSAVFGGAEIAEVERVGRRLRAHLGDDQTWFAEWRVEAGRLQAVAAHAEQAGRRLMASGLHLRACCYLQMGERFRTPKDDAALAAYRSALASFRRFAELVDAPHIEAVEVPYLASSLPAYFVHAQNTGQARPPCVVYFDGLDITKELQYLRGVPDLVRRGSCLIVDGPGNGESIRFRGFPLRPDYQVAGSAAFDYLEARGDVDPRRIAVMAISLGGYYAPRIAAHEPRCAACVAWGAIWDYQATWTRRVEQGFATQLSVPGHHIQWVLGVDGIDEALAALEGFCLGGGGRARSLPLLAAPRCGGRAGTACRRSGPLRCRGLLKQDLPALHGGGQHCQHGYQTLATTTLADWLAEKLDVTTTSALEAG